MTTIHEKAYAKLNISLDAAERRADGYHDMTMVMQTVTLCDDVRIDFNDTGRVQAKSNLHFVPGDERNLAVRAALQYLRSVGKEGQGMTVTLDKRVPVGAGMGGGSSDAAAVLRALNRHYACLTPAELETLSASVGSDVPFCVRGLRISDLQAGLLRLHARALPQAGSDRHPLPPRHRRHCGGPARRRPGPHLPPHVQRL